MPYIGSGLWGVGIFVRTHSVLPTHTDCEQHFFHFSLLTAWPHGCGCYNALGGVLRSKTPKLKNQHGC